MITLTDAAMTGIGTSTLDFYQGSSALTTLASSGTSTVTGVLMKIRQTGGLTITVADGTADTDLLIASRIFSDASYTTQPLTKAGAGTLTLTAVNGLNAATPTNINAGTLKLSGTGKLYGDAYANTAVVTINSGATLEVDSFGYDTNGGLGQLRDYGDARLLRGGTINVVGTTQSTGNDFYVANGFSGFFNMTQAGQTLTLSGNSNSNIAVGGPLTFGGAGNITINEVVEDNTGAGSIIKAGLGTLTFGTSMTYTGSTTINSGTFVLTGAGQLGGGNYAGAITNNAAFRITSSVNQTLAGGIANSGTIAIDSAANQTLSGNVSGSGLITKAGVGTLALTNSSNSITGGVSLTGGVLSFEAGGLGPSGTVSLGGGTLHWAGANSTDLSSRFALVNSTTTTLDVGSNTVTLASGFGGGSSAALVKTGVGTLALAETNDYSGGTTISDGVLEFASGGLGASGAVTVGDGTLAWAGGNAQDISSRLVLVNSTTATLDAGTNDITLANGFGAGSSAGLTKTGAGTLTLTGSNGYAGGTTVMGGTLAIAGGGSIASSGGMNVGPGAALDIAAASGLVNVGTLTGDGNVTLGGNTLRTIVGGENPTFAGVISGSGGFTKAGAVSLRLTGSQAFTGTAKVEEGTLVLQDGSAFSMASFIFVDSGATLDASGLTIVNNQTLGGYGEVAGDLSFASGGILSPGGSVGTLTGTAGTTTWNGGMRYLFEVNDASGTAGGPNGWDLFSTTGSLALVDGNLSPIVIDLTSLSGTASGSAANFDPNFEYAWKFAVAGSDITSFNPEWFTINTGSFQNLPFNAERFSVAQGGAGGLGGTTTANELYIVYAAVPEPGALALAGLGLAAAGLAAARRRRR